MQIFNSSCCRYSIIQTSVSMVARSWGPIPISLGPAGSGPIAGLGDVVRAAGSSTFPQEILWRLAEDATVGQVGDEGCRGPKGWTRATEREEDRPEEEPGWPGDDPDYGYGSGDGPALPGHLTLEEPPAKDEARRARARMRRTREKVWKERM